MKFYIVDAFSDQLFGGNTAGVVICGENEEFPGKEVMIKTAAELKYSETAFVKKLEEKTFHIRYFTPADEVELCGHATIGTFGALLDEGIVEDNASYEIETLSGRLEVILKDGFILMDMSEPIEMEEIKASTKLAELAEIMGISTDDIGMAPQLISTGLPDIMLHIKTKTALMNIAPHFDRLAELSKKYEVVGVHAFTLAEDQKDVLAYCRNFAPLYEIDEEAATGTSNGALTYYLYKNGYVKEGENNTFLQGESMNRPSKIMSMLKKEGEKVKIKVGGVYVTLVKGEIFL